MNRFRSGAKRSSIVILDVIALSGSIIAAFWLRLGWPIRPDYLELLRLYLIPFLLVKLTIFYAFGMYRRLWRYASIHELRVIVQAVVTSSLTILFISYAVRTMPIPRSVFIVDGLLTLITIGAIRFSGRTLSELRLYGRAPAGARRIFVVGAGDAGEMLVKEMLKNSALGFLPIGFIDDDPGKKRMTVHGVKVLGTREDLRGAIEDGRPDEVIIAMPSVSRQVKEEVVNVCKQTGVRCRTLPGIYELIDGRFSVGQIRDVQIEDILGRDPVTVNLAEIGKFIEGKSVLVTGAGGSIGSELCRQISYFKPGLLAMVDIAENSLFDIEQELLEKNLAPLVAVIGDVKDEMRMDEVIEVHKPEIVFHAAAYKHVPMMEMNPKAALENNFLGTLVLARTAARHGVGKLVLVSTDKAVKPVNVMGTSKALAEKAVLSLGGERTGFIIVRFGNVLASKGSVVPTFQRQIAAGGPVTITHPDMKRYLMTITESVQLILQAAAFGGSGDLFLLDMGEQVSIVELAEKMIALSGLTLDKIQIAYVGVRPGEKLEEELVSPSESLMASPHPKIFKLKDSAPPVANDHIHELEALVKKGRMEPAFAKIRTMVASSGEGEQVSAG